jgi:hypothetical protein
MSSFKKQLISKIKPSYISLALILCSLLPYFLLGEQMYLYLLDNLEVYPGIYNALMTSHKLFAPLRSEVPNLMLGQPRFTLPSELSVLVWLNYFFSTYWAIAVNILTIKMIAYFGSKRMLNNLGLPAPWIIEVIALSFTLVNFFPYFGASVAGLPLLFSAIWNILNSCSTKIDWLIMLLFPLYSDLFLIGVFILFTLGVYGLATSIVKRKLFLSYWVSIAILALSYIIVNYRVFYGMLFSDFISHRVENTIYNPKVGIISVIRKGIEITLDGQYHSGELLFPFSVIGFLAIGWLLFKKVRLSKHIYLIIGMMSFTGFLGAFRLSVYIDPITATFPFLKMFQFDRFYLLFPLLFVLLVSLLIKSSYTKFRWLSYILVFALVGKTATNLYKSEFTSGILGRSDVVRYSDYMAQEQFAEINIKKENILSIGIPHSALITNDLYPIGGYNTNYRLSHKKKFRKIIAPYLEENEFASERFDLWGNRCYYENKDDYNGQDVNEHINFSEAKKIGAEYVFSKVKIEGLQLVKHTTGNLYDIHVYRLD